MTLTRFLDRVENPNRTLVVANPTGPDVLQRMVDAAFENQTITIETRDLPDVDDDVLLLFEDGEIIESSPFAALQETILFVNSDLYRTGAQDIETLDLPAVLTALDDVRFSLRSYPESHKEKLLLIALSRYIERCAWQAGEGRLRSSFQSLSRIRDESGTHEVYETLADTAVDTHVYGVPDWVPPESFGVTLHGGYDADFTDSWFVVFTPREPGSTTSTHPHDGDDVGAVALLALEDEPGQWDGFWTFDPELVHDIERYIMREL